MLFYIMLCYVMLCYVILCNVMLCNVMLCYVMLDQILPSTQKSNHFRRQRRHNGINFTFLKCQEYWDFGICTTVHEIIQYTINLYTHAQSYLLTVCKWGTLASRHRRRPGAEFWGDGKKFRRPRFVNDFFRKKFPFSRQKFLMTFF